VRRGELRALTKCLTASSTRGTARIKRSLEARAGARFKTPKTKHGRRTMSRLATAIGALREHRRKLLELPPAVRLGRPERTPCYFPSAPRSADPTQQTGQALAGRLCVPGLLRVSFHACGTRTSRP
jgi:hypothetical protein